MSYPARAEGLLNSTTWPYCYSYNSQQTPRPSPSFRCSITQNLLTAGSMTFYSTDFQHPAETTLIWYSTCNSTSIHFSCTIHSIKTWYLTLSTFPCHSLVLCQSIQHIQQFAGLTYLQILQHCLVYKNEGISKLRWRTLWNIWDVECSDTVLYFSFCGFIKWFPWFHPRNMDTE